jgi:hypothetical protein
MCLELPLEQYYINEMHQSHYLAEKKSLAHVAQLVSTAKNSHPQSGITPFMTENF